MSSVAAAVCRRGSVSGVGDGKGADFNSAEAR